MINGYDCTGLIVARIIIRHRVGFRVAFMFRIVRVHQPADGLEQRKDTHETNRKSLGRRLSLRTAIDVIEDFENNRSASLNLRLRLSAFELVVLFVVR